MASTGQIHNDLGTVALPESLSDQQKYQVLSTIPPTLKEYPINQQKHRFHPYWIDKFSWMCNASLFWSIIVDETTDVSTKL